MGMVDYQKPLSKARIIAGDIPLWVRNSKRSTYIMGVCLSVPYWQSRPELQALKAECKRISEETGIPHELDHIVPVIHPRVCGLTVPWNIQIIPRKVNQAKSNYWEPDQLPLFDCAN